VCGDVFSQSQRRVVLQYGHQPYGSSVQSLTVEAGQIVRLILGSVTSGVLHSSAAVPSSSLAFGAGRHMCVGRRLALLETQVYVSWRLLSLCQVTDCFVGSQVILQELLRQSRHIRLDPSYRPQPPTSVELGAIRVLPSLPVMLS